MSSADNLCKEFGTLKIFLKEFMEEVNFEKSLQSTKKHKKLPSRQKVKHTFLVLKRTILMIYHSTLEL